MVELSKTFELDCKALDQDHQLLMELVNEITAMLDDGRTENCKARVVDFVKLAKRHFRREEGLLREANYPDIGRHSAHHRHLDQKMDHLVEFADMVTDNEKARESLKKELVFFLMDDVITSDLEFKPYIKEK